MSEDKQRHEREPMPRPFDPDDVEDFLAGEEPEPYAEEQERHPDDVDADLAREEFANEEPPEQRRAAKIESIEPAPPHARKKGRKGKQEEARIEEIMPDDQQETYGL